MSTLPYFTFNPLSGQQIDASWVIKNFNTLIDYINLIEIDGPGFLLKANNLSDVASASTSRTNLGVGTGDVPQFKSVILNTATKTTTYPIVVTDDTIVCTTNAFTVTLPTAVGAAGKRYTIKNGNTVASGNVITLATTSAQTIDGASSKSINPLQSVTVISDGANWWIV